jgi:signal transduction histidine kinase
VSVRRRGGEVEVVVSDDGVGGARIDAGSGLRGLSDRLAALEGELAVDSPLGEGTRLIARIPMTGPP